MLKTDESMGVTEQTSHRKRVLSSHVDCGIFNLREQAMNVSITTCELIYGYWLRRALAFV